MGMSSITKEFGDRLLGMDAASFTSQTKEIIAHRPGFVSDIYQTFRRDTARGSVILAS